MPVPPAKYGGTERIIYYLIKGLNELGHEPILVGPGDSEADCPIVPTVEKAIYFPLKKADKRAYKKVEQSALRKTTTAISSVLGEVDILHSHGADLLKFKNYPNLTTLHGKIIFEHIPYYLKRHSLNFAGISHNQTRVLKAFNYTGVVYNGLDPDEFTFKKRPQNYLCWIGRFDREKNPHLAIKLAVSLGIKIKVAGKIDYLGDGYFQEEVEPLLKNPLVEYLGEIDLAQKNELLRNAKVNLHPTGFREPFGLTVLEAAYCGTPTLAINRGAMSELVRHSKTGMLVEDFEEGYEYIKICYAMNRQYISRRARRRFNYLRMAKGYINLYEKIIDKKPARKGFKKVFRSG